MFELFEQLLLHLQQEVVVVLHLLRGVHHEGAHQVGAVRLVADPHGTRDGTEVHVVLIAGTEKRSGVVVLMIGVKAKYSILDLLFLKIVQQAFNFF